MELLNKYLEEAKKNLEVARNQVTFWRGALATLEALGKDVEENAKNNKPGRAEEEAQRSASETADQ